MTKAPWGSPLKSQASSSDVVSPPWGYPGAGAAGLRGQPIDKYSELTKEGKQYSCPWATLCSPHRSSNLWRRSLILAPKRGPVLKVRASSPIDTKKPRTY
jgi:hypothetical protein